MMLGLVLTLAPGPWCSHPHAAQHVTAPAPTQGAPGEVANYLRGLEAAAAVTHDLFVAYTSRFVRGILAQEPC